MRTDFITCILIEFTKVRLQTEAQISAKSSNDKNDEEYDQY